MVRLQMEHIMATKRPDSVEEFRRKQAAKQAGLPPPTHNTPGLPALTEQERVYVEGAREALASLRKTFDFWVAIGRGLKALHDKAVGLGGKKTYDRLRAREGLGREVINKTRSSRLLAIIDNLTEVGRWRDGLTESERFKWASPEAVHVHCPLFKKPAGDGRQRERAKTTGATAPVFTVEQHVSALIDLLKDESPQQAQRFCNDFARRLTAALNARRKQGVPSRTPTAPALDKAMEEGLQEVAADMTAALAGLAPKRKGKAKQPTRKELDEFAAKLTRMANKDEAGNVDR
jgi:hypothetical protein